MTTSDAKPESRPAPPLMREPMERSPDEGGNNLVAVVGLGVIAGLLIWLYMAAGLRSFVVVVGLIVMIFLHELGHFLTARWTGMKVTQFFLFVGPRIVSFHRKGVEYGLRMLPIGAYVRIVGMNNLDPCPPEDEAVAYKNSTYPRRMLVITAGSMMHFIQALVLFVVLFTFVGAPGEVWSIRQTPSLESGVVAPSVEAGLLPDDRIVQVDDQDTTVYSDLVDYVKERPGETVVMSVERDGKQIEIEAVLGEREVEEDGQLVKQGYLGISAKNDIERPGPIRGFTEFGSAMKASVVGVVQLPVQTIRAIPQIFEGRGEVSVESEDARRPVSVVGVVGIAGDRDAGWYLPISILAYVNIFVGVFNLVPLLPLDGGHAIIATYERIRSARGRGRYEADVAKVIPIAYATILFFAVMGLSGIWLDIFRPISGL